MIYPVIPVIRVYDEAGNVIETHEHKGDFKAGERNKTKSRHTVKREGSFVAAGRGL